MPFVGSVTFLWPTTNYFTRPSRMQAPSTNCTGKDLGFQDLWRQVFNSSWQSSTEQGGEMYRLNQTFDVQPWNFSDPGHLGFYCCSQFMVHRNSVQRRPRAWYQWLANSVAWEHCATSYMEILWHGIFSGGHLYEAKRQTRLDLPLFMRVDNFIESTADGLV